MTPLNNVIITKTAIPFKSCHALVFLKSFTALYNKNKTIAISRIPRIKFIGLSLHDLKYVYI